MTVPTPSRAPFTFFTDLIFERLPSAHPCPLRGSPTQHRPPSPDSAPSAAWGHSEGTLGGDTRPRSGSWSSAAPGKGRTRGRVTRSPPGPQRPQGRCRGGERGLLGPQELGPVPPGPSVSPPHGQPGDGAALGMTHERHPWRSGDTHATSGGAVTGPRPCRVPPARLPRSFRGQGVPRQRGWSRVWAPPGRQRGVTRSRGRDFSPRASSGHQHQSRFGDSGPSRAWGPRPLFGGPGAVPTRIRGLGAGGGCARRG